MIGGYIQYDRDGLADGEAKITAVPMTGYTFRHFLIDGSVVTENPTITRGKDITAEFYVTVADFLRGLVKFIIEDAALLSISIQRDFSLNSDISFLDERKRELARADLYLYLASSPSSSSGKVEKDFYYEHRESGYSLGVSDRKFFLRLANDIYDKYGEAKRGSAFTLINL